MIPNDHPEPLKKVRSGGKFIGNIVVPGDKSISHRALIFGAIADGETIIQGILPAEDPISTAKCLRLMGAEISPIDSNQIISVKGVGLDGLKEPEEILDCGNSGTTMRLLLGLLVGCKNRHFILTGDESLKKRPMKRVGKPLSLMGGKVNGRASGNFAPLSVYGQQLHGAVIGTPVASAQVKSAILLAALTADGTTKVIEPSSSRDHSERMLKAFGADIEISGEFGRHICITPGARLTGQKVVVPGDISSASFWIIAAAITPGSDITIQNVGLNPTRTGIIEVINQMGVSYELINVRTIAGEPVGDIHVTYNSKLKAFKIDGDVMPKLVDEVPILTLAACFCDGVSHINDASELRIKETDRLKVITRQLKKMGANIIENQDGLTIQGIEKLTAAELDSETDHRIAMTLAIASVVAKGESTIARSNAAAVSYPTFWDDLERLRQ